MQMLAQPASSMKPSLAAALAVILICCSLTPLGFGTTRLNILERTHGETASPNSKSRWASPTSPDRVKDMPVSFEANRGQADHTVKFLSRGNGYNLFLTSTEAVLSLQSSEKKNDKPTPFRSGKKIVLTKRSRAVIRMKLVGANRDPHIEGLDELPGKVNYFKGNDPKQWRTGITNYARAKYHQVYPGIDLVYYGKGQQLEYDFAVAPEADPNKIRMEFEGAHKLEIDAAGDLVLHTAAGDLRHCKPLIYQEVNGERHTVSGHFVRHGHRQVSFEIGDYDRTKPLKIDPVIAYSTLLGSSHAAWANGVASFTAANGKVYVYVVGITNETGFPVKNAVQPTFAGVGGVNGGWYGDVFVAKFDMSASGDASLIYSTYLGGSRDENGAGIAVDSAGDAYVTGWTNSTDFPILKAVQSSFGGSSYFGDAFITALNSDGTSLIYSTYLGGTSDDEATGIAVDALGNSYVTGETFSDNFPVVNAYQSVPPSRGAGSAFVAKIAPPAGLNSASVVYSTYLGGSSGWHEYPYGDGDVGTGIALDSAGDVYVTGITESPLFPTLNGFQATLECSEGNAFVTKLNPSISGSASLLYSSYLGGSCGRRGDAGLAIAVDTSENAYVTGVTTSTDFPVTSGAFMRTRRTSDTGFVTKVDTIRVGTSSLIYSTLIGGTNGFDGGNSIAVDAGGNAYVTGETGSFDFPLVDPVESFNQGVYQSIDSGSSWVGIHQGLAFPHWGTALVVDSTTSPRTLYAAGDDFSNDGLGINVSGGIFKTTDGGLNWTPINNGLNNTNVRALILSPLNASTIFAATENGIFKSTDAGSNWNPLNTGLSTVAMASVSTLAFDSRTSPPTLYAGARDNVYKIVEGGSVWSSANLSEGAQSILIDSRMSPSDVYAVDYDELGHRSSNGGISWTDIQNADLDYPLWGPIGLDPATGTLYRHNAYTATIYESVDKGASWNAFIDLDLSFGSIFTFDTSTTPSTFYLSGNGGVSRSTDGGNTWARVYRGVVEAFVIDSTGMTSGTPSILYVLAQSDFDAFVSKLNSTGSALLFSTCLGGYGSDFGNGIAIDSSGNIYVAGKTQGGPFPIVNAFQANGLLAGAPNAFVTKLGSATLPSFSGVSVTTQMAVQTGTLELTLPNITGSTTGTPPTTSVGPLDSTTTANFTLSNNLGAYEIKTTAAYDTFGYATDPTKGIKLSFNVLTVNDPAVFNGLVITHGEDQNGDGIIQPGEMVPYNGTVNPNKITYHDFASRTVWVYVPSLSPFVIVKGASDQFNDLIRVVKTFNLKAGIENSLDAKLENALNAYQAALVKDRVTSCNQMSAFISEAQAQTSKGLTQTQASQLISAARQIRVVLGCG